MTSLLRRITVMLVTFVISLQNDLDSAAMKTSSCAQLYVPASTVPLGSAVSALCVLGTDCPLIQGSNTEVKWLLNQQILSGSLRVAANQSSRSYSVLIPSFRKTRGQLECCVCIHTECEVVEGVEIRAGYPPSAPQNVTCVTNLTKPYTLLCTWVPGNETHLPTTYVLHTEIREAERESEAYTPTDGAHSYTIPRLGFYLFTEMHLFVTATNALGNASSKPLDLVPMENALLDPPKVLKVWAEPLMYSCLKIQWKLSEDQDWLTSNLAVELRWKPQDSQLWTSVTKHMDTPVVLEQCGLLHGTKYQLQMRVRYSLGPWSAWGLCPAGTTLEKAPEGQFITWLKTSEDPPHRPLAVLFWKPSKQFRANGGNMSYQVFYRPPSRMQAKTMLCETNRSFCSFHKRQSSRKLYITARNAGGESIPTEVPIYLQTALDPISDLGVSGSGGTALLVQWAAAASPNLTGYTVEWGPLWDTDPALVSFEVTSVNDSSFLISENIEPYRPYKVTLYPVYCNGVGIPRTLEAYSQQKAPSTTPQLYLTEVLQTQVKLTWDSIPLEQRNGIIQSYTIYYWNEEGQARAVMINPEEQHVTLRNLKPLSKYEVLIQATTYGGSRNGTVMTFKTGWNTVSNVMVPCTVFLLTLFCSSILWLTKKKGLKMLLWPTVPDPANSSIRHWKESDTLKNDSHHIHELQQSTLVNLSWFSILEAPEKDDSKAEESDWTEGSNSSNAEDCVRPLGCPSPPSSPCGSPRDSVAYVTVVSSSPYRSHAHVLPITYMRSESTQPLLGNEPCSPAPSDSSTEEQGSFSEYGRGGHSCEEEHVAWSDFPMLSALMIKDGDVFT